MRQTVRAYCAVTRWLYVLNYSLLVLSSNTRCHDCNCKYLFSFMCDNTILPLRPKSKSESQNFEVSWKKFPTKLESELKKFQVSWISKCQVTPRSIREQVTKLCEIARNLMFLGRQISGERGHPNFWPNFINLVTHHRPCGKVWWRSPKRPPRLGGEKQKTKERKWKESSKT